MQIEVNLVGEHNLQECIKNLEKKEDYGFDTETYGKNFSDRMFSLAISTGNQTYYFNFYTGTDHEGNHSPSEHTLDIEALRDLKDVFKEGVWYSHNAKFDLLMLRKEGIIIDGRVRCTAVTERLLQNDEAGYSLEAVAARRGYQKDKSVDEYIKEHKLYEERTWFGKPMERVPQFYKVPFNILAKYATQDAWLHYVIGKEQYEDISKRTF